jgi:hypothetical protein
MSSGHSAEELFREKNELAAQDLSQTLQVSTLAEKKTVINCREIEDWCRECKSFRPHLINAVNLFGISLGLFVGFLTGLASTSRHTNGTWWGAFLLGTLASGIVMFLSFIYVVVTHIPRLRKMLGMDERLQPTLQPLAERMDRAMTAGMPQAQAVQGLEAAPNSSVAEP